MSEAPNSQQSVPNTTANTNAPPPPVGTDTTARNARHPGVALVLQGGGARAAYQAGVLQAVCELLGNPKTSPFPIITGTSAGAINAAVLASHADDFTLGVSKLVKVWENFSPAQVYRVDVRGVFINTFKWLRAIVFSGSKRNERVSLFDNSPLPESIAKVTNLSGIEAHIKSGALRAWCVTCAGYTSGQNVAFFHGADDLTGWRRSQRVGIRVSSLRMEHLLASAAIPFAFPAVKINREYFGDGSIRQTSPLSPALHLGAQRIFVVGTAKLVKDFPKRVRSELYPSLAQIAGHAMSSIFLDTLAVDIELLQRLNSTLAMVTPERLKQSGSALQHVDVLVACPNEPLETLAYENVNRLPWTIRLLLRFIGAMRRGGSALTSYLLFDSHYCTALIDLGYKDTMARGDEVRQFFDPEICPMPTRIPTANFDPGATIQIRAYQPGESTQMRAYADDDDRDDTRSSN